MGDTTMRSFGYAGPYTLTKSLGMPYTPTVDPKTVTRIRIATAWVALLLHFAKFENQVITLVHNATIFRPCRHKKRFHIGFVSKRIA